MRADSRDSIILLIVEGLDHKSAFEEESFRHGDVFVQFVECLVSKESCKNGRVWPRYVKFPLRNANV